MSSFRLQLIQCQINVVEWKISIALKYFVIESAFFCQQFFYQVERPFDFTIQIHRKQYFCSEKQLILIHA